MTEQEIRLLMQQHPDQGEKALFDAYYTYVYAIAFRRIHGIGTHEDVEECVIDVFLEVMQRFDSVCEGSLKSYIGMIAKNKAINVCRYVSAKSRRTDSLDDMPQELASSQDVANDVEQTELTDRLLSCISALGEPDATIILQKYFYDRKSTEIARLIGKSPAWVRNRCARALKRLRKDLADLH